MYRTRYQAFALDGALLCNNQAVISEPWLFREFMNVAVHHYHIFIGVGHSSHPQFTFRYDHIPTFTFFILRYLSTSLPAGARSSGHGMMYA